MRDAEGEGSVDSMRIGTLAIDPDTKTLTARVGLRRDYFGPSKPPETLWLFINVLVVDFKMTN